MKNILRALLSAGKHEIAPAGSAGVVMSFRNIHNWIDRDELAGSLRTFHKALKPGGGLGIVGHRGRDDLPQEVQTRNGYVRQGRLRCVGIGFSAVVPAPSFCRCCGSQEYCHILFQPGHGAVCFTQRRDKLVPKSTCFFGIAADPGAEAGTGWTGLASG